jgi:hypothetical protein
LLREDMVVCPHTEEKYQAWRAVSPPRH